MDYEDNLTVFFYDKTRVAKFERLVEDTENNKSETIRELIDDEFERRDLEINDNTENDNTTSIMEKYDSEGDFELEKEELKQLIGEVDEINPNHVVYGEYPTGSDLVRLVEAMARYRSENISKGTIILVCKDVGITSDYYLSDEGRNVPKQVLKRLGADNVQPDSAVSTKNNKEVISKAVETILVRNVEDGRQAITAAEKVRSIYNNLDEDDRIKSFRGKVRTDEVITSALYHLSSKPRFEWNTENLDQNWPTTPESLLSWYRENESVDWMEDGRLVDSVRTDLREFAGLTDKDIADRGTVPELDPE